MLFFIKVFVLIFVHVWWGFSDDHMPFGPPFLNLVYFYQSWLLESSHHYALDMCDCFCCWIDYTVYICLSRLTRKTFKDMLFPFFGFCFINHWSANSFWLIKKIDPHASLYPWKWGETFRKRAGCCWPNNSWPKGTKWAKKGPSCVLAVGLGPPVKKTHVSGGQPQLFLYFHMNEIK